MNQIIDPNDILPERMMDNPRFRSQRLDNAINRIFSVFEKNYSVFDEDYREEVLGFKYRVGNLERQQRMSSQGFSEIDHLFFELLAGYMESTNNDFKKMFLLDSANVVKKVMDLITIHKPSTQQELEAISYFVNRGYLLTIVDKVAEEFCKRYLASNEKERVLDEIVNLHILLLSGDYDLLPLEWQVEIAFKLRT